VCVCVCGDIIMAEVSKRKTKYILLLSIIHEYKAKADVATILLLRCILLYIIIVPREFGIHHGLPEQPPVVRCINDITM